MGVLHSENKNPALVVYSEDKVIMVEFKTINMGRPVGSHLRYHPSGKESFRTAYKNGKKHGKDLYDSSQGKVIGECEFSEGIPVGKHWINYENGNAAYLANYDRKGALVEPAKVFLENGHIKAEVFFKDGERDGPYKEWHENGALSKDYFYVAGQFEDEQKEFHENSKLKLKAFYKNKVKDGVYQEWYEDGYPLMLVTCKRRNQRGCFKDMAHEWEHAI
jgi:antitoxin component YwqK of YwqJK toxin-antitoxin module